MKLAQIRPMLEKESERLVREKDGLERGERERERCTTGRRMRWR